jgi:hypothetical protein
VVTGFGAASPPARSGPRSAPHPGTAPVVCQGVRSGNRPHDLGARYDPGHCSGPWFRDWSAVEDGELTPRAPLPSTTRAAVPPSAPGSSSLAVGPVPRFARPRARGVRRARLRIWTHSLGAPKLFDNTQVCGERQPRDRPEPRACHPWPVLLALATSISRAVVANATAHVRQ